MAIAEGRALLAGIGWLADCPPEFRAAMLEAAIWREMSPGRVFNRAGDREAGIWGVASGQINLGSGITVSDSPIADVQLPGSWGGFGPLFLGQRAANAEAAVPSLLALVPYQLIRQIVAARPEWWEHFGRLSTLYTVRYGTAVADLLVPDSRLRLIAVLLRLADCRFRDNPAGVPVTVRLSQQQLGQCANLSRQLTGPVLHELQAERLIEVGYREVTIRDAAALRRILEDG